MIRHSGKTKEIGAASLRGPARARTRPSRRYHTTPWRGPTCKISSSSTPGAGASSPQREEPLRRGGGTCGVTWRAAGQPARRRGERCAADREAWRSRAMWRWSPWGPGVRDAACPISTG
jgi:hypothetical protein